MITLTVQEIYDLAAFAGIGLDESRKPDDDSWETPICIGSCPGLGVRDEDDEIGKRYRFIAWLEEYPEEGVMGLGPEIEGDAELSGRAESGAPPTQADLPL